MTNYSDNPGMVRVDYFKPSGKWYMTEAINMNDFYDTGSYPGYAVKKAVEASRPNRPGWSDQFQLVCVEPYHRFAYPVLIKAEGMDDE